MRHLTFIFIILFGSFSLFGQKRKLPPKDSYYVISEQNCEHVNQSKTLEVLKDDSLRLTTYRTDSTEMIIYRDHFVGFLTGWENKKGADSIYIKQDSLVNELFVNGLLTSDLLIEAFNIETKVINHKGDTLDWTSHIKSKTVKLLNIQKKEFPKNYKDRKNTIVYEIWATFNAHESGWGSFPMFDLYLVGNIKPTQQNFKEYLKTAKIKCLRYTATQI